MWHVKSRKWHRPTIFCINQGLHSWAVVYAYLLGDTGFEKKIKKHYPSPVRFVQATSSNGKCWLSLLILAVCCAHLSVIFHLWTTHITFVLPTMVIQRRELHKCITFGHHTMVSQGWAWRARINFVLHKIVSDRLTRFARITFILHIIVIRHRTWDTYIVCSLHISVSQHWTWPYNIFRILYTSVCRCPIWLATIVHSLHLLVYRHHTYSLTSYIDWHKLLCRYWPTVDNTCQGHHPSIMACTHLAWDVDRWHVV